MDSTGRWFPAGRSRGVTVVIDGLAAFVWFGWGQAAAPSWLVVPFAVGAGAGLSLLGFGLATLMARDRDGLAAGRGKPYHRQFLLFR